MATVLTGKITAESGLSGKLGGDVKETFVDLAQQARQAADDAANSAATAERSAGESQAAKQASATAANDAGAAANRAEQAAANADKSAGQAAVAVTEHNQSAEAHAELFAAITPDDTVVSGKPWTSKKTVDSLCMPIEETGNPVQVYPIDGYPLGVKVSWEPTQAGEGDPSPDNIRPIIGRDAVSVTRCGKNLVEHLYAPGYTETKGGLTFTINDDYSIKVKGTATSETYFNFKSLNTEYLIANYIINAIGSTVIHNGFEIRDIVVQPSSIYHRSLLYLVIQSGKVVDTTYYPTIVYGSTATPYEHYTGTTTNIALPETVYGGTLDVSTGVLNMTWGNIASYAGEALPGEWISDRDVYSSGAVPTTGAQVVYKLAEPYTIQLTPQQIAALSGVNTLYTDAGTLTVTGREDPRHTIVTLTDRIAALESAAGV